MPKYAENMRDMIGDTIRANIHRAAIELIREQGWNAFTTEKIAERLGVSRGVLYHYFENKEAIARSIIERSFEELNAKLETIAGNGKSARERLLAMAELNVADFISQRELHRTFMENMPPPPLPRDKGKTSGAPMDFHRKRDAIFRDVISDGVADGEFAMIDIEAALTLLCGGLHELCFLSIRSGNTPDAAPIMKLFLKGIRKP